MNISSRLVSHVRGKNREEFTQRLIENKSILDRIITVLEADIRKSRNFQIDRESFRNPEWANQVAYEFGYQKALEDVINLIELRNKDVE